MRRSFVLLGILFALGLATLPSEARNRCGRDRTDERFGWCFVAAVSSAAGWGGPWLSLGLSDGGGVGMGTACACQPVYLVSSDGDAGVALAVVRNSQVTCSVTGHIVDSLSPGDYVLCDGGLPAVEPNVAGALSVHQEASRVNSLLYPNARDSAPWVAAAGVTITPDVALDLYGSLVADRLQFVPGAVDGGTLVDLYQSVTRTATVWTDSDHLRSWDGGTGCVDLSQCPNDGGACKVRACSYGALYSRCSLDAGLAVGPWTFSLGCNNYNNASCCGVAPDIVVAGAQAELGDGPTSLILSGAATATRANTVLSVPVVGLNAALGGSVSMRIDRLINRVAGGDIAFANLTSAVNTTGAIVPYSALATELGVFRGGVSAQQATSYAVPRRVGAYWDGGAYVSCVDGVGVAGSPAGGAPSGTYQTLQIGAYSAGGSTMDTHLSDLRIGLTNAGGCQ